MPALQVFGMRPCPRAVVAGAGAGFGRVPPSTLYTRVLALKVAPLLAVEVSRVEHQVRRDVADHFDVDLPGGEVPAVIVAAERVKVPADDDRLQRHRLGVLDDAEGGPGTGGSLWADLDDRIEHQVPGAGRVAVSVEAPGCHREQLGDGRGARRPRLHVAGCAAPARPSAGEGGAGKQLPDCVEVAGVDQLGVPVEQLRDGQLVLAHGTCAFTTGRPGSLAASIDDGAAPAAIRCAANEAIIAPLSVHSRGRGIRSVSPLLAQRSSASSRSREFAATPPAISSVFTLSSLAAWTAFLVSTSATASWKPAAMSACVASG